jgi:hypothetical protein
LNEPSAVPKEVDEEAITLKPTTLEACQSGLVTLTVQLPAVLPRFMEIVN